MVVERSPTTPFRESGIDACRAGVVSSNPDVGGGRLIGHVQSRAFDDGELVSEKRILASPAAGWCVLKPVWRRLPSADVARRQAGVGGLRLTMPGANLVVRTGLLASPVPCRASQVSGGRRRQPVERYVFRIGRRPRPAGPCVFRIGRRRRPAGRCVFRIGRRRRPAGRCVLRIGRRRRLPGCSRVATRCSGPVPGVADSLCGVGQEKPGVSRRQADAAGKELVRPVDLLMPAAETWRRRPRDDAPEWCEVVADRNDDAGESNKWIAVRRSACPRRGGTAVRRRWLWGGRALLGGPAEILVA